MLERKCRNKLSWKMKQKVKNFLHFEKKNTQNELTFRTFDSLHMRGLLDNDER